MPNKERKEYYLYAQITGKEVEIMNDTLKNIDKFTTWYDAQSISENIFDDEKLDDFSDSKIILRTSHKNIVDIAYSSSRNVIFDENNRESYESFLHECIYNGVLLKFLNELMNKRISTYSKDNNISKDKLEKYSKESIYFWDENFKDKLDEKNYNRENRMYLLNIKKSFDEINKSIIMTRLLNDLLEINKLKEKFEIESFLREDYVEQENDRIKRLNLEKRIMQNLSKFNENYRDYRDLYLLLGPLYETKMNINNVSEKYKNSEYDSFITPKLSSMRDKIINSLNDDLKTDVSLEPSENLKSYAEIEKEYIEELNARKKMMTSDEDINAVNEELGIYSSVDSHPVKKL